VQAQQLDAALSERELALVQISELTAALDAKTEECKVLREICECATGAKVPALTPLVRCSC
jgi:hypothetical protein